MTRIIVIVGMLFISPWLFGQQKSVPVPELQEAREIMASDPQRAIKIIQRQLNKKSQRSNPALRQEAYELLGDVYMSINQQDLALERYVAAERVNVKTDVNPTLLIKKGRAQTFVSDTMARNTFEYVLEQSIDRKQRNTAIEAIADIDKKNSRFTEALERYKTLETVYTEINSPKDLVRIQSKMAQVYSAQNDASGFEINFQNAYSNIQRAPEAGEEDIEAYDAAVEQMVEQKRKVSDEISIRSQNVSIQQSDPTYQAVERVKLADAYVRNSQVDEALSNLKLAELSLKDIDAPAIKADISKKKSEAFVLKGKWQDAIRALEDFEKQNGLALEAKQQELDRQIEIVKGQQAIDLDEKEFINKNNKLTYERDLSKTQSYIIALLSLLLAGALFSLIYIGRSVRAKNKANMLLQLKGLRAQMNPHFIFNALNTVNEYIVTQDERKANQYLTDFSSLMRRVLQNSQKDLIPLSEELEMTKLYIELEHRRFSDKFDFDIHIPNHFSREIMVPPLLFQPYIENAIWHGLRYRDGSGALAFDVREVDEKIEVQIVDNGIGRQNSMQRKTKNQKQHKSTGLQNTGKRLELINSLYQQQISLHIDDVDKVDRESPGTRVVITIS